MSCLRRLEEENKTGAKVGGRQAGAKKQLPIAEAAMIACPKVRQHQRQRVICRAVIT